MKKPPLQVPEKPIRVADPLALLLQIVGFHWIRMGDCRPPDFLDFIALKVKGPLDYTLEHCRFDGSGDEGLEDVVYWFPAPALPKRAADGFPPHEMDLGKELRDSLQARIRSERRS